MADAVLRALAAGGLLGSKLADIIQKLVVKAAELGELETYQYLGARGDLATGQKFPARWLDRLGVAIETGSIEIFTTDQIIDIVLQGPR
jgi:hypothetical protein